MVEEGRGWEERSRGRRVESGGKEGEGQGGEGEEGKAGKGEKQFLLCITLAY